MTRPSRSSSSTPTAWRECVAADFDQSKTHLYRQLEAAKIEASISPIGEIGTIPERQLRELVPVPEFDRKAAWELALESAPGGKMTAEHVAEVVAQTGVISGSRAAPKKAAKPARKAPDPPLIYSEFGIK
jgi:hypothetical protein